MLKLKSCSCLLPLLLVFLIPASLSAQPVRSWVVAHDEGGIDRAGCADCATSYLPIRSLVRGRQALAADAAGNVYATGSTTAGGTQDVLTVKYDTQGVRQWAISYNAGDDDRGFGVAVDGAGNVYVTGQSVADTNYGPQGQMITLKYNASGVLQWETRFEPAVSSAGLAVAVDVSGNVYVAGEHYTTSDYVSMVTVKYSPAGVQQWARHAFYGYENEESSAYDLALDGSGNVHVTGFLYKPSAPGIRDYMTVKYSPAGSQLWLRAYESGGVDEAYDVAVDGTGNVFVGGTSGIVKYDAAGTQQWVSPFDGTAHALIAVGGAVFATGVSNTDLRAARYDAATGARPWSTALDLGGTEQGFALRLVGGNLYVAGSAGANALVAGFDRDTGSPRGSDTYDRGHNDVAYAMAFTGTSDFWVAGTSGNGVDDDLLLIEYTTQPAGPVLQSLTLTPASFAGACKTSIGKVTLSAPAPAGGTVVSLSTSNPAARVPASVTVPAGATTAKFTISGTAVSSPRSGWVTASIGGVGGVGQSAVVTVRPIGVAGLTVSPNPVVGPAMTQGTVTLECPAGAGGVTVMLTTSNSQVATPAVPSLTVPAGSSTATFAVLTSDVSVESSANLRATAAGVWKAVKVTVSP